MVTSRSAVWNYRCTKNQSFEAGARYSWWSLKPGFFLHEFLRLLRSAKKGEKAHGFSTLLCWWATWSRSLVILGVWVASRAQWPASVVAQVSWQAKTTKLFNCKRTAPSFVTENRALPCRLSAGFERFFPRAFVNRPIVNWRHIDRKVVIWVLRNVAPFMPRHFQQSSEQILLVFVSVFFFENSFFVNLFPNIFDKVRSKFYWSLFQFFSFENSFLWICFQTFSTKFGANFIGLCFSFFFFWKQFFCECVSNASWTTYLKS